MVQGLDWGRIRCFSSTGEASSPEDSHWLSALAGYKPVIEYIGGTELGGAYLAGSMVQPQIPSAFSTPVLGVPGPHIDTMAATSSGCISLMVILLPGFPAAVQICDFPV